MVMIVVLTIAAVEGKTMDFAEHCQQDYYYYYPHHHLHYSYKKDD
jgi:hypothetical protein